jgi:hypothetical protein
MRRFILFLFMISLLTGLMAEKKELESIFKGPYLGQKPPGMIPVIFAPHIVSRQFDERMAFFTADGRELYYQLRGVPHTVIVHMKEANGHWQKPEIAFFSGKYFSEFSLSPDGSKIVYCSNQPANSQGPPTDRWTTFMVEKTKSGWSLPRDLKIRTGYPTISSQGNIYFFGYRKGGKRDGQIFMSEYANGKYSKPVNISNPNNQINSDMHEIDPFIAPDESYLIFCSNRPNGFGDADLYITFRRQDGSWTKAINMGESINTNVTEFCPSVSPDGKYLFFSSNRILYKNYSQYPISYEKKIKILNSPGNGSNDIYWVSAVIIAELKKSQKVK